jgi:hypothetical protein
MVLLYEQLKKESKKAAAVQTKTQNADKRLLDIYCVAATIYGEAKDLDTKGITRVAETIRNRYTFYNKNKAPNVGKIYYRDIVAAPRQYNAFSAYKNKSVTDFRNYEKKLTAEEREKWNRCMAIAKKVVNGQLKTDYARGAMSFNKSSIARNKRAFKTDNVFADDSNYYGKPDKHSPHVFIGDCYMSPLRTATGRTLAFGGYPNANTSVLAQARKSAVQNGNG